jgi:glycosyltransferase involved in cell wall biosynthesis
MLISVGILAHNEEKIISRTIGSLLKQSVFVSPEHTTDYLWEIVVVPNGCTDNTHEVSEHVLTETLQNLPGSIITSRVRSLALAGKSNAWNEFIHNLAHPSTEVVVMIDADIEFGHPDTLKNAVECLLQNEKTRVVVDLPMNDLTRKPNPNLLELLLAKASWIKFEGTSPGIAGSFYCARASTLREIWMPVGLPGEDGFLAAMILTDCFRSIPNSARVIRAANASHYYEGLTSLRKIIQHEIRLVIGTTLNIYLCWYTLAFLTTPSGPGSGHLIRALNDEMPGWYDKMMASEIASRGLWVLPHGMLVGCVRNRFRGWRKRTLIHRTLELPMRLGAIVLDVVVLWIANRKLRKNIAVGYW